MNNFIRKHPAASYFILAIAISWGAVLAVILPGPIPAPPDEAARLFVFVYLAMLAGPPIAGIVLTRVIEGPQGLRAYRERLLKWNVGARWYAVALLSAPLVLATTLLLLSLVSDNWVPGFLAAESDPSGPLGAGSARMLVLVGLAVGIGAGFFEELGWTGFATPQLRKHHSVFTSAMIIGVIWGAWHFVAIWWGSADSYGEVPVAAFLVVALFSFLPPYRVLMAMVYAHTGSLLIGILMHTSLTASMLIIGPMASGRASVTFNLASAIVLWSVVVIARIAGRRGTAAAREMAAAPR